MLGERGEQRQVALPILVEAEQAGDLLADQVGGQPADRRGGARREGGDAQRVVGLPGPVGGGAQEIVLALGRGGAARPGRGRAGAASR